LVQDHHPSTFATATAWDWMLERGKQLAKFPMPSPDATFPADAMTAVLAALMLTGVACERLARPLDQTR
jgi:hypothetical protein